MSPKRSHKILVTGGAGFIGSHIVDHYIQAGHTVCVLDDLSHGSKSHLHPKVKFYEGSISDFETVETLFKKEKPDIVNHHAAQIDVRISVTQPQQDATINILGLLNILECGQKNKIKKLIVASSGGALYGELEDRLPTEKTPPIPTSHYGVSKFCAEEYVKLYHYLYQIPFTLLRYSNVYGPRQSPIGEGGVVAFFTHAMLTGKTPIIFGDGKQTRDFVYVEDVAIANERALEMGENQTINIGFGKETSILQLFELLKKEIRFTGKVQFKSKRRGEIEKSALAIDFAKKALNWEPKTTLPEGLKKTFAWQKERFASQKSIGQGAGPLL